MLRGFGLSLQANMLSQPQKRISTFRPNVRFGSLADICSAKRHVRFAPNSDRESGFPANGHVRFTPESGHAQCTRSCLLWANSGLMHRSKQRLHSITSSIWASNVGETGSVSIENSSA
jgi:hypothetical protein